MKRRDFIWKAGLGLAGLTTVGCPDPGIFTPPTRRTLDEFLGTYTPVVEDLASANQEPSHFLYTSMLSDAQEVSLDYNREDGTRVDYNEPKLASAPMKGDFDGNGKVNIWDLLKLLKYLKDPNAPVEADIDGNGKVNIFDLIDLLRIMNGTYDTHLIKGTHFDNDTEQGARAEITVNGKTYDTNDYGLFNIRMPKGSDFLITARQANGFKRTIQLEQGDYTNLNLFSVSYPTQEGVTPELFKAFCEEACFSMGANGFGYKGLKTGLKNEKNRFWISSHGDSATYSEGGRATAEEQNYVKSLIENEIYPHLISEYHFPIYVEDPNAPEQIPAFQDGVIAVIPREHIVSFGFAPSDNNQNGIMDNCLIYLPNGGWNDWGRGAIREELASSLFGMNDVNSDNIASKTVLNGAGYLTQIDDKLIKIQHRYQPKEDIENILGL